MEAYQQRVREEHAALAEKIQKLEAFISSPKIETVTDTDKTLLEWQLEAMEEYALVLRKRICRF